MNATTKKQTAGNNAFLRNARKWLNGPLYAESARLVNEQGESAARAYLLRYFRTLDFLNEMPTNA